MLAIQTYNPEIHTYEWCAKNGYLEVLKWLHFKTKNPLRPIILEVAAKYGNIEIVKWFHMNSKYKCYSSAIIIADKNGHSGISHWLIENKPKACTPWYGVIPIDNSDMSKWIYKNAKHSSCLANAVISAVKHNEPKKVIEYIYKYTNKIECIRDILLEAVMLDDLENLKWFYTNIPDLGNIGIVMEQACMLGNLSILTYFNDYEFYINKKSIDIADKNGHKKTAKWARRKNFMQSVIEYNNRLTDSTM